MGNIYDSDQGTVPGPVNPETGIKEISMFHLPAALTQHDHPDCEDFGSVIENGPICPYCEDLWWEHVIAETETVTLPP